MNMADIASFGYDSPFTPTRTRKKRKNTTRTIRIPPDVALERTRKELLAGDWMSECKQLVRGSLDLLGVSSPEVLCLGLGSPVSSRDARAQLAFLLEACDHISLERSKVSAYDPVFMEEDEQLLDRVAVQRLTENRSAAYPLSEPTIAFMPHCDLQLYENFLRENWSRERLSRLVLIANRLSEYVDSHSSQKLSSDFPCISRIAPLVISRPLPSCPSHPSAFNNISIQFTNATDLNSVESTFWNLPLSRRTGIGSEDTIGVS